MQCNVDAYEKTERSVAWDKDLNIKHVERSYVKLRNTSP